MTGAATSPGLERVRRGRLCSGCGGCAALAPDKIALSLTEAGFLRPRQTAPLSAAEEERLRALCPGLAIEQPAMGRAVDPLWGPLVSVHRGFAQDPALRHRASSGGLLSALLVHLLETRQVDFVLQTVADPESPLANRMAQSRSREEVLAAAGSRYAPSAPLAGIGPLLDEGRPFAFVGKPCDVVALRALERQDPRVSATIPFMLSFFCAGVPSLRGAEAILAGMAVPQDRVVAFRYRGMGWPGAATARLADGSEKTMSYSDSWGGILSKEVQFRCKLCPDGVGGAADLACADAWHCDERGYPLFEEAEGLSLAVARTAKGEALLRAAQSAGSIRLDPLAAGDIDAMQPGQTRRKSLLAARLLALRLLLRPTPRYRGTRLLRAAGRASPLDLLRNLLGTGRRVLRGRYRE